MAAKAEEIKEEFEAKNVDLLEKISVLEYDLNIAKGDIAIKENVIDKNTKLIT